MHLKKRPTWFVKGDDRRKAFYTVQARELMERGYVEEGADIPAPEGKPNKTPEIPVVVGEDAYETVSEVAIQDEEITIDFSGYKKADLIEYAQSNGIYVETTWLKAEILKAIEDADNG